MSENNSEQVLSYLEQVEQLMQEHEIGEGEGGSFPRITAAVIELGVGSYVEGAPTGQQFHFESYDMFDSSTVPEAKERIREFAAQYQQNKPGIVPAVRFSIHRNDPLNYSTEKWTSDVWHEVILSWSAGPKGEDVTYWSASHKHFPENLDPDTAVLNSVLKHCAPGNLFGKKKFYKLGNHSWNYMGKDAAGEPQEKTRYASYVMDVFSSFEEAKEACGDRYNGNMPEGYSTEAIPMPEGWSHPLVGWPTVAEMLLTVTQEVIDNLDGNPPYDQEVVVTAVKERDTWDGLKVPDQSFVQAFHKLPPF